MKNHPACNTPLVRKLRQHCKGDPARWKEVYNNLKVVYALAHVEEVDVDFDIAYLELAFTWRQTPQGYRYWRDLNEELQFFRDN